MYLYATYCDSDLRGLRRYVNISEKWQMDVLSYIAFYSIRALKALTSVWEMVVNLKLNTEHQLERSKHTSLPSYL